MLGIADAESYIMDGAAEWTASRFLAACSLCNQASFTCNPSQCTTAVVTIVHVDGMYGDAMWGIADSDSCPARCATGCTTSGSSMTCSLRTLASFTIVPPANSTGALAPWGQRWDSKGRGKMNGGGNKGKGKGKRNAHRRGKGDKGQGRTYKDP